MTISPAPTPPPGWYPDPNGGAGQKYWDGSHWTQYAAPPPPAAFGTPPMGSVKKRPRRWPWVLGAVVGFIVIVSANSGESDDTDNSSTTRASTPGTTTPQAAPRTSTPAPVAAVGQPVRDGKFEFVVTDVSTATTVGDPSNEYMQTTAQGVYVVVSMAVKNIGDQAQSFFADNQKLKDSAGREYSADSMADMWMNEQIMTDINPGNYVAAKVAFDVPSGTQPSEIELHDSMFSFGVPVKLGNPR